MAEGRFWVHIADIAEPCPHCGGLVRFGALYDWTPGLGGDFVVDELICKGCHREWYEDGAPPQFSYHNEFWNVVGIAQIIEDRT